jgi:peptide chain release factor 1
MKPALRQQLQRLAMRLAELDAHLADPALSQDIHRYRTVAREQAEAASLVQRLSAYEQREADLAAAQDLLAQPGQDVDMAEMAREEITAANADLARLLAELQAALLPKDPDDARTAFVEIQDGDGKPRPGFTFADCEEIGGNFVDQRVYWNGKSDLSSLAGKPVRLQIQMKRGKLYAFQFTNE